MEPSPEITNYLNNLGRENDGQAGRERAIEEVYRELREMAERLLVARPGGGNLTATGLVHDLYAKLLQRTSIEVKDRSHFFAIAAKAMQNLVIDERRKRVSQKRGGGVVRDKTLDEHLAADRTVGFDLLSVRDALDELERDDERAANIVRLKFFVGLEMVQIADILGVSKPTVEREWRAARAWLTERLS